MRKILREMNVENFKAALDIGTGSGVLALILAHRGIEKIYATDINPNAIKSINENSKKLGYSKKISPILVDPNKSPYYFLNHKLDLIVTNPPWFNKKPLNMAEAAIYDLNLSLLMAILEGLKTHLNPNGVALIEIGGEDSISMLKEFVLKNKIRSKILSQVIIPNYTIKEIGDTFPYAIFELTL